jgi:hypothetical protein
VTIGFDEIVQFFSTRCPVYITIDTCKPERHLATIKMQSRIGLTNKRAGLVVQKCGGPETLPCASAPDDQRSFWIESCLVTVGRIYLLQFGWPGCVMAWSRR